MNKFEKNDLVEYIGDLGVIHCQIDNYNCYVIDFETKDNMYCLIAQAKDIKLISKNACNKVFKVGDKVFTLKGKGIINSIDEFGENVMYGVSLFDGIHYFFRCEVWEDNEQ